MPRKHVVKKARKTKRKTVRNRKTPKGQFISTIPARMHQPIPLRWTANFEYGFFGTLAVGSAASNNFYIGACSVNTSGAGVPASQPPGNQGNPFTGGGFGGTLIPATTSLTNLYYTGVHVLNNIYSQSRIHSSKISVTMCPTVSADIAQLVVLPINVNALGTVPTNTELAMSEPLSKAVTCTGNNNIKSNRVSCYVNAKTFYGLKQDQYDAFTWDPIRFIILYQLYSNAVSTGLITFEVKMTSKIEFYNQLPLTDTV